MPYTSFLMGVSMNDEDKEKIDKPLTALETQALTWLFGSSDVEIIAKEIHLDDFLYGLPEEFEEIQLDDFEFGDW